MQKTILAVLGLLLCVACGNTVTRAERKLIGSQRDSVMRVLKVTDREDSLLLRKTSREVSPEMLSSEPLSILCSRMLTTVTAPENDGVGIAAPQVGLLYNLIAVQRFDKPQEPFEFYANPKITFRSEECSVGREGCLSVPDRYGMVSRSDSIVLEYVDPTTLQTRTESVVGFTAVIFQHETDHLAGVLYTDKY